MLMTHRPRRPQLAKHLLAIGVCCILIAPFLWMISTSFKGPGEISLRTPTIVPHNPKPANYSHVLQEAHFGLYFLNSLIVSVATTLISVALATLAGYAFARFRLPGGKALLLGILATQMFPGILLAIPLYILIKDLGLLNSLLGLILVYTTFALPFSVWMLRNFFLTVPRELEESAMVDGATRLGALWRVILPIAAPGIAATSIFSFILAWNEFLYANTFISSSNKRTLAVGLQALIGEYTTDWGMLMAGAVITTLPIVVAFVFIQRNLTQGLAAGAVKG